jgi:hypothetical protein
MKELSYEDNKEHPVACIYDDAYSDHCWLWG